MRWLWRLAPCLAWSVCAWATTNAAAQDVVPPKLESMPPVEVPAGVELPETGKVRAVVIVEADGTAVVEQCDAGRPVCDVVDEAIGKARFVPATRDGVPVVSRVQIDVRLRAPPEPEEPASASAEEVVEDSEVELAFSETAEVEPRNMNFVDLDLEAIRNIPGTLGDPYRVLELMPCVVPIANGQPYGYVCGAPPAGTAFFFDELRLPLLFHSALGPATIHPAIIKDVKFFLSAPPARYGSFTGGVLAGDRRTLPNDRVHGEAELRVIDASAMLNVPLPKDGSMTFSGRYGFPNLIFDALNVDADVEYWDYQHSTDIAMTDRSRFQIVALGSRDRSVFDENEPTETLSLELEFHRVEARFVARVRDWNVVGTLLYGFDKSLVQDGSVQNFAPASARLHRFGPRFWASYAKPKVQLRVGGDVAGFFGPIVCEDDPVADVPTPCDPDFAAQDRRVVGGLYIDTNFVPLRWLDLSLGVRGDIWGTSGEREAGVSPRARTTFHANETVDIFVGWGFGIMPATYAIPLPGLGELPLEPGLQRANQLEGGFRFFLPKDVSLVARGYVNFFRDLRFLDIFTNPEINVTGGIPVGYIGDTGNGESYGATLLLQRAFQQGFSTIASYSLGFNNLTATAFDLQTNAPTEFDYTPSYDVRHVINAVLTWASKFGLTIAARVSTRSGRTEGFVFLDLVDGVQQYTQRVPWFTRLDAQIAYGWSRPGRHMRIGLEWVNITRARDAQELSTDSDDPRCVLRDGIPESKCPITFTTAVWYPNLSFRAQF